MAQFARPDSDIAVNSFLNEFGTTTLWSSLDEVSPSDTDYVGSEFIQTQVQFECGLSDITDPASSAGHIIRFQYQIAFFNGSSSGFDVILMQGATPIATASILDPSTGVWLDGSLTLSGAEADAITDYSDLRLRGQFTDWNLDSSMASGYVSWLEFEVPAASLPPNEPTTLGTFDPDLIAKNWF